VDSPNVVLFRNAGVNKGFFYVLVIFSTTIVKPSVTARKRPGALEKERPGEKAPMPRRSRRWVWAAVVMLVAMLLIGGGLFAWHQIGRGRHGSASARDYVLVTSYPHDPAAYCQGLVYHEGYLYEGTGKYGESSIRKVKLESGDVLRQMKLDERLFGEGITIWKDHLIQLTWKSRQALVYDVETFQLAGRFAYRGEGWGLTHDGQHLIMSNGTDTLQFLDPSTFNVKRRLTVRDGRHRIGNLNELEYVEGEIYANIWYDDRIVRISPETGRVIGWLDLSGLYPKSKRSHRDAVLNGIAYDSERRRLFVTGKDWPRLYEIQLPQ